MTDLVETDAEFDDHMAALEAEANAMVLADDEQELSQELADLDNQRTQEEDVAKVDEELANLEAALAEDNKEEEEEESLEAQLSDLNNEQEITDADADKAWVELERVGGGNQEEYFQFPLDDSDSGETQDPELADAFVVPAAGAAPVTAAAAVVPAAAERKGWFHKTTGFSTNRIPGWQRMRKWTGLGGRTRRRRRNTHKKRSRRRKRHTRKKRKTRKPRRKRKKRKTRKTRKTRRKRRR